MTGLSPMLERLAAVTAPLRGRLGVDGVTLVGLLAGLATVLVLAVGFTDLLDDVLDGEGIAAFDGRVNQWLAGHRESWLTDVLLALTRMGNADVQAAVLAVVCIASAAAARSWFPIVIGSAGGAGIGLVIVVAKELIGRPRPAQPFAVITAGGYSFPSGHATGAAAIGLLCAWMLCRWVVHGWPLRIAVWTLAIATVGLIGFSRPYLGVHFPTDVLAGWTLGAGWAVTVIVLASWRSSRSRQEPAARSAADATASAPPRQAPR